MANFCLVPQLADKFKKAIVEGEINPEKLSLMTSPERHAFFSDMLGEHNATNVNALFESKLLLKNQQAGMITWAKKLTGISKEAKRDIISKIERMDKILSPENEAAFLEDLANTRLGIDVTYKESAEIAGLSKEITDLKESLPENSPIRSKERIAYGIKVVELKNYLDNLKLESKKLTFGKAIVENFKHPIKAIGKLGGVVKSILSSLDNSYFGRQGIKVLYTHPDIWVKNFAKSWKDMGQQVIAKGDWYTSGDDVVLDAIKADLYSRPNAVNGKYQAGGFGLDMLTEEAYPSSLPEKIPLLGRLFKASEAAYNGAAMRIRADLADRYIKLAEEQGVNMSRREEAKPVGDLISSLTGRGNMALTESQAKTINEYFFSIKFLKSNFDTLIGGLKYPVNKVLEKTGNYQFKNKGEEFKQKQAAKNLLKIVATVASILALVKLFAPDRADLDPRSKNFGKIKIGDRWVDITGGMGSIVTLASQITPTQHNGKWGFWSKNAKTGVYTNLGVGFGVNTPLDILEGFFEGKLSPMAGLARDIWSRQMYTGDPVTFKNEFKQAVVPLTPQTSFEMLKDHSSGYVLGMSILEGLGFSGTPSQSTTNWSNGPSAELKQFKEKVGDKKFQEANDEFNKIYKKRLKDLQSSVPQFKSVSDDEKSKAITKLKDEVKNQIFRQYSFKYKK